MKRIGKRTKESQSGPLAIKLKEAMYVLIAEAVKVDHVRFGEDSNMEERSNPL